MSVRFSYLSFLALLCCLFAQSNSTCTIENNLRGTWMSSEGFKQDYFSNSYIQSFRGNSYTWECYEKVDDSTYIYRSNYSDASGPGYEYTCVHLEMLSTTRYSVSKLTPTGFSIDSPIANLNASEICTRSAETVPVYMKSVYWKKGMNDYMDCPSELQTIWSYQAEGEDSFQITCNNQSRLDVCANKGKLQFDLTKCTTVLVNASKGELGCLTHWTSNSLQYIILENPALEAGSACMVYRNSKATIRGGICRDDQTEVDLGTASRTKESMTYMNFRLTLSKVMDTCPVVSSSVTYYIPSLLTLVTSLMLNLI